MTNTTSQGNQHIRIELIDDGDPSGISQYTKECNERQRNEDTFEKSLKEMRKLLTEDE